MWKAIGKPQVVKLDWKLAEKYYDMQAAPSDRPLRQKHMRVLENAIKGGKFREAEFASIVCKEDGKEYRVNGKHTANVLVGMNGDFPKDLSAILKRYEGDTLHDVADCYTTFDAKISSRTASDLNAIFAASHPSLIDIPRQIIDKCVTGIAFSEFEEQYSSQPAELRAEKITEYPDFAVWFHTHFSVASASKHLWRGSVIGAMFKTFEKAQKQSTEFWVLVRDASGPDHTTPDRALNKMLISSSVANGRGGGKTAKKHVGLREMHVKCIHAWNAWRKKGTSDLKYFPNAKTPSVV